MLTLGKLYLENSQLISQIERIELENLEMKEVLAKNQRRKKAESSELQENELREFNMKLTRKIEFLQKRERELLEKVMLLKSSS